MSESKHYFTLDEANSELVRLRELFSAVMQLRGQLKSLYQRLDAAGHPPREEDLAEEADEDENENEDDRRPPPPLGGWIGKVGKDPRKHCTKCMFWIGKVSVRNR